MRSVTHPRATKEKTIMDQKLDLLSQLEGKSDGD